MTTINSSQYDQPPTWTTAAASTGNGDSSQVNQPPCTVAGPNSDNGNNSTSDDAYTPSSILSCPPLIHLQAYGFCCPFIETEEEHDARIGVTHLQNYPITWYRKKLLEDVAKDVKGVVPSAAGGLLDGLGQMFGSNGKKHHIPMTYVGVPATLSIVDTDDHGPVIAIRTLEMNDPSNSAAKDAINNYLTTGKPWWEDPIIKDKAPSKVIPFYMVDKVASGWSMTNDSTAGGVKLYSTASSKGFLSGLGPELLRFDTLGGGGNTLRDSPKPDEPNKYSDKIIVQLKSLVDWNRRRMARGIKHGTMGVAPKSTSPGYVAMT